MKTRLEKRVILDLTETDARDLLAVLDGYAYRFNAGVTCHEREFMQELRRDLCQFFDWNQDTNFRTT